MLRLFLYLFLSALFYFGGLKPASCQSITELKDKLEQAVAPEDSLNYLIQLTMAYRYKAPHTGIQYGRNAISLGERINDSQLLSFANTALGNVYYEKGEFGLALEAYSHALNRCIIEYDNRFVASCLNNIGKAYRELGFYSLANEKFEQAIEFQNKENDNSGLANSYLNLGVSLFKMKDYDQAMQSFNTVLDISFDELDPLIRATTFKNVGNIFLQRGEYSMATEFYNRALRIYERLDDQKGLASIYNRLGLVNKLMAEYPGALEKFVQAAEIYSRQQNQKRLAKTYLFIAEIKTILNLQEESAQYINQAIAIGLENGFKEILQESYHLLYEIYSGTQDLNAAFTYYRKSIAYKDSIRNESLIQTIAQTETRNAFLQHELNPDSINNEKQLQKYTRLFALVLFFLAVIIVVLAFSRLINQRKANRVLAHQRNILKQTLNDLKISEEKYKALFSKANDAIFLMDNDTFIDCNDKTLHIFECEREDIVGQPPYTFSPKVQPDGKKSKAKAIHYIKQCYKGKPQRFYWVHTKKDGTVFDADVSLNIIQLDTGKYIQAIVRDISDRVRAEKEMVEAREKAEKATESKTFFLAKMSHEIRTMLGGITSSAQLLKDTTLEKDQSELLDIIDTSADNLLGIVNEILDMSKIEAGKIDLEERPFLLKETLQHTVNAYLHKAKEKKISLYLSIHPRVPEQVAGDELRLRQILNNLISNAIKFTDKGHVTLEAEVIKEDADKYTLGLKIADTGIGIPESKMRDMFSAYSQLDVSISRRYGGTGLGLNIAYKLIHLMQGTIEVDSELDIGTTFTLSIPFNKSDADLSVDKNEEEPISSKKYNILLAEDNIVNQKITMINLQNLGHKVVLAVDGKDAWKKYLENEYDIILMDVQMPVMDGIEVTHLIRDHEKKNPEKQRTRIIALTANILGQDAEYCLAEGMDDFIGKPFKVEEVVKKIEKEKE
jgi:PAS domain S-box-containing protein